MNQESLLASVKSHEGLRLKPYKDSQGVLTCGYGRNLEKPISAERAEQWLREDLDEAISELDRFFPTWKGHSDARQNVLIEMCFNLGAPRLAKFQKFWTALSEKNYPKAAYEMLDSDWSVQIGKRAVTLSERMENDTFA